MTVEGRSTARTTGSNSTLNNVGIHYQVAMKVSTNSFLEIYKNQQTDNDCNKTPIKKTSPGGLV
jgi:hypothetical protein